MIPDSVTEIGSYAFNCETLTDYIVGEANSNYSSYGGILFNKNRTTLISCPPEKAGEIIIPSSVTNIDAYAFSGCIKLNSIVFPKNLERIKDYTIYGCYNLRKITILGQNTEINPAGLVYDENYRNYVYDDKPYILYKLYVVKGSPAERYSRRYYFDYEYVCNEHIWNHEYAIDSEATCVSEGSSSIHCTVCDAIDETTIRVIPKKGHTYGEWVVTKEASDTERGMRERRCTVCGGKEQEKIPATAPLPIDRQVISGIVDKMYTGKTLTLSVEIKSDGELLIEGTDYNVSYRDNINVGIATVIITGKGDYKGSAEKTFHILPGASSKVTLTNVASGIKIRWVKVPGATSYYVYRGDTFLFRTSALEATDNGVKFNDGTKYVYKVVATTKGIGDSPKARTATTYRLMPVGIKTLTNPSAGKMTVTYEKNYSSSGYVVRFGLKSDMSDAKVITVKGAGTSSATYNVKKGKIYYVQVRAYKIEDGVRYYSGYSTTKTVKIMK